MTKVETESKISKTKNTIQAKGITLIALVITIVILIILATVAMSFVFGEDGLISRAQQAAELTEVQNIIEQMELAKAEVAMENGGKVNVDDFFEKLEENAIIGSVENDVVDNGDGTYDIVTDDGYEFEITVTPDGDIEIEYSGKGDEPRIRNISIEKTSNSVTITVETKNADGGRFTYSYKKNSEGEESWQEAETNITSNTCTIENLEANEIYNIKVKLETDKGTVERTINVQVGEMPVGKVNFASYVWQGDGTASIVINTTETGYTLQYQKVASGSSIQENSWTDINSGETITGLVYGDTVYGRLWDGINESEYANATIDDDLPPQEATINLSGTSVTINEDLTATVTLADNESGVDITGSKWVYNTTSTNIGTDEASYTNSFTTNPEEITLQATTVGTYYLHVLTKDTAGNKVEKISNAIEVIVIPNSVEEAKEYGVPFTENKTISDKQGNKVVVPKGFKIASDSGTTVQQGIVIEDAFSEDANVRGSQYVWIPIGTFKKDDGSTSKEIVLGRYLFDREEYSITLEQAAYTSSNPKNYTKEVELYYYGFPFIELPEYRIGRVDEDDGLNTSAYELEKWVNSARNNGGYYIGRYEASYASGSSTEDFKAASKISTGYTTGAMSYVPGTLWNGISQVDASKIAINTYKDNANGIKSDLINSYAWDTAVIFIMEAGHEDYYLGDEDESLSNTGTGEDEVCKINDMGSNAWEWTTEYSPYNEEKFGCRRVVYRGNWGAGYRTNMVSTVSNASLRLTLYFD